MFTTLKAMCFYVCSVKLCDKKNTTLICSTYLVQNPQSLFLLLNCFLVKNAKIIESKSR